MDKLEKKYKTGDITPEELTELRSAIMSMPDDVLEQRMLDDWQNGSVKDEPDARQHLEKVKQRIDRQLFGDSGQSLTGGAPGEKAGVRQSRKLHIPWGWIAAAVMVPLLMLSTIYYYRAALSMESGKAVFATAAGQQARVDLPDGTAVTLNSGSSLAYSSGEFNTRRRNVDFSGEAYFDVAGNKNVPFLIHSGEMTVRVVGTKFNLEAYPDRGGARLSLDEGKVEISSGKERRTLEAGQVAVVDYADGSITVTDGEVTSDASAWMKHEIVFRGSSLEEVIVKIEQTYGVKIHCDDAVAADDTFSGSIPADDLVNALEIVKLSYGLHYKQTGKEIYFLKD